MSIDRIYAQLACRDLEQSVLWFERLFGRPPDAHPVEGLVEWHHQQTAGLQVFRNPENAGKGALTLIVIDLREEHARLEYAGLRPARIQPADTTSLVRLRDPDHNLVVLAQPRRP